MNKKNKILVGCLALLLVLSVGYALFSETVTINGTATAKGNFDITTTCFKGVAEETGLNLSDVDGLADWSEGGFENDICTVVDNKVSFAVDLKYPSAARFFTVKAENTGSIPAELVFAASDDGDGLDNTTVNVCKINDDGTKGTCSSTLDYNGGSSNPFRTTLIGFGNKNGFYSINSMTEDMFMDFVDVSTENIVLETGESIYYVMGLVWDKNYTSDTNSASYTFEVTTEIPFTQVTN